jgi:valyl-tRNA synthetase
MAGDIEVLLVLPTKTDTGPERAKLEKDRGKLTADRDYLQKKLANQQYLEKAPAAVLEKDRGRLAEIEAALEKVLAALSRLS